MQDNRSWKWVGIGSFVALLLLVANSGPRGEAVAADPASIDVTSGFDPQADAFPFRNEGSVATPDGHPSGMALLAHWWFLNERPGGTPLSEAANVADTAIWEDNAGAIGACAKMENSIDWTRFESDVVPGLAGVTDSATFRSIADAIESTGKPQLVAMRSAAGGPVQVSVAYRVAGSRIYLLDPSRAGGDAAYIEFDAAAGRFAPYAARRVLGGSVTETAWVRHVDAGDVVAAVTVADAAAGCDRTWRGSSDREGPPVTRFVVDPVFGSQVVESHGGFIKPIVLTTPTPTFEIKEWGDAGDVLIADAVVRVWHGGRWHATERTSTLPLLTLRPGEQARLQCCAFVPTSTGDLRWLDFFNVKVRHGPWIEDVYNTDYSARAPGRRPTRFRAASPGVEIVVSGEGFGARGGTVHIGGKRADVVPSAPGIETWNRWCACVYVPEGLAPGWHDVVLTDSKGVPSNPRKFLVLPPGMTWRDAPKIDRVDPDHGLMMISSGQPWSRPYCIYGDGFGDQRPKSRVTIGGTDVQIMQWQSDFILFRLGGNVGSGEVVVHHHNGLPSNGVPFEVISPGPTIPNIDNIHITFSVLVKTITEGVDLEGNPKETETTEFVEDDVRLVEPEWAGNAFRKKIVTETTGGSGPTTWTTKRTTFVSGSISSDARTIVTCRYFMVEEYDSHSVDPTGKNPDSYGHRRRQVRFTVRGVRTDTVGFSVSAGGDPSKVAPEAEYRLNGTDVNAQATVYVEMYSEKTGLEPSESRTDLLEPSAEATFHLQY